MITKAIILSAMMLPGTLLATSYAQRTPTASMNLTAGNRKAVAVPFNTTAPLSEYITPAEPINWGMDVAWNWDVNVRRGTNFIGKDVLNIGRVSFQPSDLVDDSGNLSDEQQKTLQSRLNNIAISGVKDIMLNCDHEVLCKKESYPNADQNYKNYYNKPQNWVNVIKASATYCQRMGFNVVAVAPLNEPDYTEWKEGNKYTLLTIVKALKADPFFDNIRICGPNTLNCDQAYSWYTYKNGTSTKDYLQEGNTHQLAGSMASYTAFWETLRNDGKRATADELHNTMEAFIGIHHGMQTGIWWGWDGACRGEFCKASAYGKEIGYAEDAATWTGAAVYKWNRKKTSTSSDTEQRINIFAGASERQAKPQTYNFISTDRPVYFDGYGPVYSYQQFVPGDPDGKYQGPGQKNAERMLTVQYGEDAPTDALKAGNFVLVNVSTGKALGYTRSTTIVQQVNFTLYPTAYQYWIFDPVKEDQGGDFGYFFLRSPQNTAMMLDLWEGNLNTGALVKAYAGPGGNEEQWFFEYADKNSWYVRSKHSGMYMQADANSSVKMRDFSGEDIQKWRLVPVPEDPKQLGKCESISPAVPSGLTAQQLSASVALSWQPNADTDLAGYNIYRCLVEGDDADITAGKWDMIGRMVTGTQFIDNDVTSGATYIYKIKAVDKMRNISDASSTTAPATIAATDKRLIAQYTFENNTYDISENLLDAVTSGTPDFTNPEGGNKEGCNCFCLTGSNYLILPPAIGNMRQMTICGWVNVSKISSWMRIFDFGNDTDHYFFLTTNAGSKARLVFKNGGAEQIIEADDAITPGWKFIAVTLSDSEVSLYINSKKKTSTSITIRPDDFKPRMNYIGASQFAADPLFTGNIDDLRIYNYPLSAAEVATLRIGKKLPTGDANRDGKVTVEDANIVSNYALGDHSIDIDIDAADMDLDEKITIDDAKAIVEKYLNE